MIETLQSSGCKVGSPSHSSLGRISWPIMKSQRGGTIRLSNFIEMTVMILHRTQVIKFLKAYAPYANSVVGWGCDYIVQSVCQHPFVIFDNVSVVNPTNDQKKIKQREIESLSSNVNRFNAWKAALKHSNGLFKEIEPKVYSKYEIDCLK
jgi:hypothetical protein